MNKLRHKVAIIIQRNEVIGFSGVLILFEVQDPVDLLWVVNFASYHEGSDEHVIFGVVWMITCFQVLTKFGIQVFETIDIDSLQVLRYNLNELIFQEWFLLLQCLSKLRIRELQLPTLSLAILSEIKSDTLLMINFHRVILHFLHREHEKLFGVKFDPVQDVTAASFFEILDEKVQAATVVDNRRGLDVRLTQSSNRHGTRVLNDETFYQLITVILLGCILIFAEEASFLNAHFALLKAFSVYSNGLEHKVGGAACGFFDNLHNHKLALLVERIMVNINGHDSKLKSLILLFLLNSKVLFIIS